MNKTKFIKERILEDYGSVRRFANKIGMPVSTLTTTLNKENGFNNMPVDKASKVCKALGIDVESLYSDEPDVLTPDQRELLNTYRAVSEAGKTLILKVSNEIRDYEEQLEEQLEKPKTLKEKKFLIAASGGENASREEIEEAIELAKKL